MLYLKVTASLKEMMVISSGVFVTLDRLFHSFYGHVITKNVPVHTVEVRTVRPLSQSTVSLVRTRA